MKIGILTSGGDTPGMNAVIRAVFLKSRLNEIEIIGFKYGWKGLIENITVIIPETIIDSIDLGGTILKSGRVNPFKNEQENIQKIKNTIKHHSLNCVIAIGGEDTLGAAFRLYKLGIPMIGVPKTIDNDLNGTDVTFGFNTAIQIVSEAFDRLKTTAISHERIMVVEIMGRHAGWMTLHGGIAGGAHVILIPEYQISIETICEIIKKRYTQGNSWALIAVSEGFGFSEVDTENLEKDEFGHVLLEKVAIGSRIAELIQNKLGYTTRATVLGHTQRGGTPSAYDRVLCTQLGLKAVDLAIRNEYGMMPALKGTKILPISLQEAISKLKIVDEESWQMAKDIMNLTE